MKFKHVAVLLLIPSFVMLWAFTVKTLLWMFT